MKPSVINQPETTTKSPYTLHSTRSGSCWNYLLENKSSQDLCVAEVTLGCVDCPGCTFYGEGFNMLSQYGGPVEAPQDIGEYSDRAHYRMPTTPDAFTVYNFLHLTTPDGIHHLLAFASCHRFRGEFRLSGSRVTIVLNLEDYLLRPGEKLALEELFIEAGRDLEGLYDRMAACIASNHPRLLPRERSLSGWCSWYAYGEHLTRENLLDNLTFASREFPEVRYFLIDDGYENKLGDWLEPNPDCGDTGELCRIIREHGKKPAIWVAPFIAEKDSRLLAEHPDWFVQGDDGRPLCSADVTFGGWRRGPWYILDATHPQALDYLYKVFRHMKKKWKCDYFKLDANNWGALPFGRRHRRGATAVEAYRQGMFTILSAIGPDSTLLGCNAPLWPSLGLVHSMRVSGDIFRSWKQIRQVSCECFHRAYMRDRLWRSDPDCALVHNIPLSVYNAGGDLSNARTDVTRDEFIYLLTAALTAGSAKFLGDPLTELEPDELQLLHKFLHIELRNVRFTEADFSVAEARDLKGRHYRILFNTGDQPAVRTLNLRGWPAVRDYWTDERMPVENGRLTITVPAHGTRLIRRTTSSRPAG